MRETSQNTPAIRPIMAAIFTKNQMMPKRLLRIQKATITPTTPTTVMATACEKVTGFLPSLLLTSLLTDPMLRSAHAR